MSRLADETPRPASVPDKPVLEGLEAKWDADWEASGIYRFDETRPRAEVFSIDTPPPTVSGSLHVGHVFSYTHTDIIARYRRMAGQAVFYPMGWDDNGLPTERRVQNYYGVRCDPSLPYDPDFAAPPDAGRPSAVAKRRTPSRSAGPTSSSCARSSPPPTSEPSRTCSGASGCRWTGPAPTPPSTPTAGRSRSSPSWRTSTAARPTRSRRRRCGTRPSRRRWLRPSSTTGRFRAPTTSCASPAPAALTDVWIDTTRPELVPSCVALVAHPDDGRYQPRFGSTVRTPVFDVEVPVLAHPLADPEKGTGIAMICTFGDTADVTWWRELNLPVRTVIGRDGRLVAEPPAAIESAEGRAAYARLAGKTAVQARKEIAAVFTESGDIDGEPRPITHPVKFFEKGDRPLEIVSSRQWYIRNGGRDDDLRQALIDRGSQMNWVPAYMQARYESWIAGLNGDWLISRQRFFGVPIPLWYSLGADGTPRWDNPIRPDSGTLPVDPSADCPPGCDESQRGRPGGFMGDPDVMDTWATSSLTPQIATGWRTDEALYASTFPMDMRPQAHDIIRTWLFSTVVRAHFDADGVPWHNCALSGWILDPDRKKMSKSRGNVQVPTDLLERYGADAVRYWAACGRPGTDTAFDEQQFRIGRRLAVKLLNASKFVLRFDDPGRRGGAATGSPRRCRQGWTARCCTGWPTWLTRPPGPWTPSTTPGPWSAPSRSSGPSPTTIWSWSRPAPTASRATAAVCHRPAGRCGPRLEVLQQLFAPFMPFVAEEVWSWWHDSSVHASAWPRSDHLRAAAGDAGALPGVVAASVLGEVRRAKSEAKRPLRTEVVRATVTDTPRAGRGAGHGRRRRPGRRPRPRAGHGRGPRAVGGLRASSRGRRLAHRTGSRMHAYRAKRCQFPNDPSRLTELAAECTHTVQNAANSRTGWLASAGGCISGGRPGGPTTGRRAPWTGTDCEWPRPRRTGARRPVWTSPGRSRTPRRPAGTSMSPSSRDPIPNGC